jgi:hypothetical protein
MHSSQVSISHLFSIDGVSRQVRRMLKYLPLKNKKSVPPKRETNMIHNTQQKKKEREKKARQSKISLEMIIIEAE